MQMVVKKEGTAARNDVESELVLSGSAGVFMNICVGSTATPDNGPVPWLLADMPMCECDAEKA